MPVLVGSRSRADVVVECAVTSVGILNTFAQLERLSPYVTRVLSVLLFNFSPHLIREGRQSHV
jgi:hypothetical protein